MNEYIGGGEFQSEIMQVTVNTVAPGAQYGLDAYNLPRMWTRQQSGDTAATILQRLLTSVTSRGLTVDNGQIVSEPGRTMGLRVDATPGSYLQTLVAGQRPTPKQVRVQLPLGVTGGTFTLTSTVPGGSGETTSGIAGLADASALDSAIEGLSTPQSGDITCILEAVGNSTTRRSYLMTLGGSLAGKDVSLVGNGASLTGTAKVNISTIQEAGQDSKKVVVCWFNGFPVDYGQDLYVRFTSGTHKSNWVTPVNAMNTSVLVAPKFQKAIDQAAGAGKWVATPLYSDAGGAIFLAATDSDDREEVTISCVYAARSGGPAQSLDSDGLTIFTGDPNGDSPSGTTTMGTASEVIRAARSNQNEIVAISVPYFQNSITTYAATFNSTTETIYVNDTESALLTNWETLAGSGNVDIYANNAAGAGRYIYAVVFKGSRANANQGAVTATEGVTATVIQQGTPLLNQIDQISIQADSGTFTLTYAGGSATSSLAYNLSAGTLQTALRGQTEVGSGNCNVTGSGSLSDPFRVEYVSGKAATVMPALSADVSSLVGGFDPEITTVTAAVVGQKPRLQLNIDRNATGGYLRIIGGGSSGKINFDDTASEVETALDAHTGIAALTHSVAGEFPVFVIDFAVEAPLPSLEISQIGTLTVSESSLLTLTRSQEARGPNCWDDPDNWSAGHIPSSGETVILRDGSETFDEGLRQRSFWVRSGSQLQVTGQYGGCDFQIGQGVYLRKSAGGSFPTATQSGSFTLSDSVEYVIQAVDRWSGLITISTDLDDDPIVLTSAGSGTFEIEVRLEAIYHYTTHVAQGGEIGLPRLESGRRNERCLDLRIGASTCKLSIGDGIGGHSRINLDLGKTPCAFRQENSGSAIDDGERATNIRSQCETTHLDLLGGSLAIGLYDTADAPMVCGNVTVRNGSDLLIGHVDLEALDVLDSDYRTTGDAGFTARGTIRKK